MDVVPFGMLISGQKVWMLMIYDAATGVCVHHEVAFSASGIEQQSHAARLKQAAPCRVEVATSRSL
ncbi:hypothetical protein [Paraburkholderia guartelaensis]|uniref:hypothetical protein n=1 Tax=Paraburkholderia guartelaensis TaxID=2546446 RepID=UPI002AB5E45F|nr:hypothetical protein [Paraburkholderia guartelaensis]